MSSTLLGSGRRAQGEQSTAAVASTELAVFYIYNGGEGSLT